MASPRATQMQFHIPLDAMQRRDSSPSLAMSPLTTARTGCDHDPNTHRESIYSQDVSTAPNSTSRSSLAMVKFDVSDFLAPLEARVYARIGAVESMVEHRCGALEQRLGQDQGQGQSDVAAAGDFQQQLDDLRRQLLDVKAQVDATNGKTKVWNTELNQLIKASDEKQATLKNDIDELWRQLKADRQQGHVKYQEVSDALEKHVGSLMQKIEQRPAAGTPMLAIEEEGDDFDPTLRAPSGQQANEFVQRSRSTPSVGMAGIGGQHGPVAGRERSPTSGLAASRPGAAATPSTGHRSPLAAAARPGATTAAGRAMSPRSAAAAARGVMGPPTCGSSSARQSSPSVRAAPSAAGASAAGGAQAALERKSSIPHEAMQRVGPPQRGAGVQRGVPHPGGVMRSPLLQSRS